MNLQGRITSVILIVTILAIIIVLLITANNNVKYPVNNLNKDVSEADSKTKEDIKNSKNNSNEAINLDTKEDDEEPNENNQDESANRLKDREKAKEYNAQGYDLYIAKEYEEALKLFEESIYFDDSYLYGHYNYACTLGVLMKQDYETWFSYKQEIIKHLWKVQELNTEYIQKIKTDSDLDLLRKEFDYYLLLGFSPNDTDDVKEIIQNLSWYVRGEGAYSILGGADFKSDNTFDIWYYDFSNNFEKIEYKGRYEVTNNKITLNLNNKIIRNILRNTP